MRARDILDAKGGEVIAIGPEESLDHAISTLSSHNIGAVLVLGRGGQLAGILSERDVIRVLDGAPKGFRETKVKDVMTARVFTASPDASVDELLDVMTAKRCRHLPVVDGERLVGMVSIGDVVKYRIREAVGEAEALKSYIAAV